MDRRAALATILSGVVAAGAASATPFSSVVGGGLSTQERYLPTPRFSLIRGKKKFNSASFHQEYSLEGIKIGKQHATLKALGLNRYRIDSKWTPPEDLDKFFQTVAPQIYHYGAKVAANFRPLEQVQLHLDRTKIKDRNLKPTTTVKGVNIKTNGVDLVDKLPGNDFILIGPHRYTQPRAKVIEGLLQYVLEVGYWDYKHMTENKYWTKQ